MVVCWYNRCSQKWSWDKINIRAKTGWFKKKKKQLIFVITFCVLVPEWWNLYNTKSIKFKIKYWQFHRIIFTTFETKRFGKMITEMSISKKIKITMTKKNLISFIPTTFFQLFLVRWNWKSVQKKVIKQKCPIILDHPVYRHTCIYQI